MLRRAALLLPALVRSAPLKRPFSGAASPILADAAPYWHEISRATDIEALPTPSLIVLMDRVRANVNAMISAAGGDPTRWRPHLKTTKLRPVWRELLDAGVRSFKCATVREATLLLDLVSEEKFDGIDLLVAYPLSRPNVLRLAELAAAHGEVKVAVLCEDEQGVADTPEGLEIWLDVNPLHYNRTGAPAENADQHAAVVAAAGARFAGVHYYDGHLDSTSCAEAYDELVKSVLPRLPLDGTRFGAAREVPRVTSGTPTFEGALRYDWAGAPHQISPGTVVFTDVRTLSQVSEAVGLQPAALVLCRAVSRPAADVVTLDVGSKSVAAEVGDPCVSVVGRPELEPLKPSEEHLPVRLPPGASPIERNTPLLVSPVHVCPTVNLAEAAVVIDGDDARVVPVEARAH